MYNIKTTNRFEKVFRVIEHESVDSNFVDGFPKWKSKINEQLI
jgi:hypothetical protein